MNLDDIEWSGGNDYCIGRVHKIEIVLIQRNGPRWDAFAAPEGDLLIASGSSLREAQDNAVHWLSQASV